MLRKLLHSVVAACLTLPSCTAAPLGDSPRYDWPGSLAGLCYPSVQAFVASEFPWTLVEEDENIKVQTLPRKSAAREYVWVSDTTPSVNSSRRLLEIAGEQACVILDVVHASSVDLQIAVDGLLPAQVIAISSPPPGFPATSVTYRWDSTNNRYWPTSCERFTVGTERRTPVECKSAFDE